MVPDPKWLEILKASGWQSAAIAGACGLFLLFARWGWIPALEPWMIHLATAGLLLSGLLALASFINAAYRFFPVDRWVIHYINRRREQRAVTDYIPHMTEDERKIIAYLLAKNQKMFTGEHDGGYAITLISRRIVVRATQAGQGFYDNDVPYAIPDHLWQVFVENRDKFPYTPPPRGETEVHPWRVPWQLR